MFKIEMKLKKHLIILLIKHRNMRIAKINKKEGLNCPSFIFWAHENNSLWAVFIIKEKII